MTNKAVAKHLKLAADLIELTGGNAFRARAFASAARTLERMDEPVSDIAEAGDDLTDLNGIGKGLARDIRDILATGSLDLTEQLLAAIPPGVPEMLRIKGLGTKKVRAIWTDLGVTSIDELEAAAAAGRLATLDGFGEKTAENVLKGIDQLRTYQGKEHFATVVPEALAVRDALRGHPEIGRADLAGAVRRQMEVIETVDVVTDGAPADARHALETVGVEALAQDATLLTGTFASGMPLTVRCVSSVRYGTALWESTGSAEHVDAFTAAHGMPDDHADEDALFEAAGLAVVPPPLREGRGELKRAADGEMPTLLRMTDLRGTLHNHTTYSDGTHTLRQMAEAAREIGLDYFGVADHSRSLTVAHGLSIERLHEQIEEVSRLNAGYAERGIDFRIFSGSEVDILTDGSMDYPNDVLAELDVVVASVHTAFQMTESEATKRLIAAVSNPYVDILGHPTGRLLLRREGYSIDHQAVLEACAETGTAVELNANPYRLDLDWRWIEVAVGLGVPVSINPDAHAAEQLAYVRWGVAAAQKGGLTPEGCLTARSADDLAAWLVHRRPKA